MKGRLTIRIDEIKLFFNTICDLEITEGRATIFFKRESEGYTVAFTRTKVFVFRKSAPGDSGEYNEALYVISEDSFKTRRTAFEIEGYTVFFYAEGMRIDLTEKRVYSEIKCFMSLDDKKTEEYLLKLECLAIDN